MWEEKTFEPHIKFYEMEEGVKNHDLSGRFQTNGHVEKTAIQKFTDFLNEKDIRDFHILSRGETFDIRIIGDTDTLTVLYFNKHALRNRQI